MGFRSDGLLRGSRESRIKLMDFVKKEPWDVDTILDLYTGLIDHAEDVRAEAMMALWEIAWKQPVPVSVTPINNDGAVYAHVHHRFSSGHGNRDVPLRAWNTGSG